MSQLLKLLELLESVREGKSSLSLYKAEGLCWEKRGELPVTKALLDELRAVSRQSQLS